MTSDGSLYQQRIITQGKALQLTIVWQALQLRPFLPGHPRLLATAAQMQQGHRHMHALPQPALDFMQTMPVFVYLIPAVMLFGLGCVPGIIATVIFAVPRRCA